MPRTLIPVVSLFCGPGGMDLGFRQAGFVPLVAIDESQSAVDTYNWNDAKHVGRKEDIRTLSNASIVELIMKASPEVAPRGVIGGPPCQSFSSATATKNHPHPRPPPRPQHPPLPKPPHHPPHPPLF